MFKGIRDWKLKLRYGKIKTPYKHFTVLADGIIEDENAEYLTSLGPAVMGLKVWSLDQDEASEVARVIGRNIGFNANGKIEIYTTDPEQPPSDKPSAYGVNFTPYDN